MFLRAVSHHNRFLIYTQSFLIGNTPDRNLLNDAFVFFSGYFIYFIYSKFSIPCSNIIKLGRLLYKNSRKIGTFTCLTHIYTVWIFSVNMILIVISNKSILNPGPRKQPSATPISILYHNARGFMVFDPKLPNNPPTLNITKVLTFQAYIFQHKPDIIIINESWLNKTINSNEIFPNQSYKVFRVDRSSKTHPFDINKPKKFRKNGGGVLIAVRNNLDIKSTKVESICKAEILSIVLSTNNRKKICISTCYRVGNLEVENHSEIDRHLRNICKRKDISKHILIGDFNLDGINWPLRTSSKNLDNKFLDTFSDLNMTQLIDKPTHELGKTLDLLLCTSPQIISAINVQGKDEICSSDHFGISFNISFDCKRLRGTKRKMYNFKKANWGALNSDIRRVNWDACLKFVESTTAWSRFKYTISRLCDKHIPKITIKSQFQPPWFDSDIHKLCAKKERLRQKFIFSKNPVDKEKFKLARKNVKLQCRRR